MILSGVALTAHPVGASGSARSVDLPASSFWKAFPRYYSVSDWADGRTLGSIQESLDALSSIRRAVAIAAGPKVKPGA
jgi:hypothetical protein